MARIKFVTQINFINKMVRRHRDLNLGPLGSELRLVCHGYNSFLISFLVWLNRVITGRPQNHPRGLTSVQLRTDITNVTDIADVTKVTDIFWSLPGPSCPDRFAVPIDDFINQHHPLGLDRTGTDNVGNVGNVTNRGVLLSGPLLPK